MHGTECCAAKIDRYWCNNGQQGFFAYPGNDVIDPAATNQSEILALLIGPRERRGVRSVNGDYCRTRRQPILPERGKDAKICSGSEFISEKRYVLRAA